MIRHFLLLLSLLATPVIAADAGLPSKEKFHLFLLAGQSNMAGRGKVDDEGRKAQPGIHALNKDLAWQPATDPLHWDKPAAGVGVGKPFAAIIAARQPGISIGLIPAACGGSSIDSWTPGGYHDQTKSHPYDDALARARRAQQDGVLKAILWHQGESDSGPAKAAQHEKKLTALIARFRSDLNEPDLPFIIGQLGQFPARPWNEGRKTIDAAHQAVARQDPRVRFVTTEDLTSHDDLHFDTPSLRILAQRYAEAYLDILAGKPR